MCHICEGEDCRNCKSDPNAEGLQTENGGASYAFALNQSWLWVTALLLLIKYNYI